MNPQLMPADVVFTRGMGVVRFLQQTPGEGETYAGHVAGIVTPGEGIEALWRVQRFNWSTDTRPCRVYRNLALTGRQRINVSRRWQKHEGRFYAPLKLGLHAVDWGLSWGVWALSLGLVKADLAVARRLSFIRWLNICSQFIAAGYEDEGVYRWALDALKANPDGMEDECRQSQVWELVYEIPEPQVD